jgi:hypothetical protein
MINSFDTFEEYLKHNQEYVIGIPSGEVIYINDINIKKLKFTGYIKYDKDKGIYFFNDGDYEPIKRIINNNELDEQYIIDFLDKQKYVEKFKINKGCVDVIGDVIIRDMHLEKIPFKFGKIEGDFIVSNNSLFDLENCPKHVMGSFDVSKNMLLDLYGGPTYVGDDYDCSDNFISSLKYMPRRIFGNLNISNNHITSFDDSPEIIDGNLICQQNAIINYNNAPKAHKIIK